MVHASDTDRDVVVACLTRDDFVKNCHEVLQEVLEVLGMLPRSRTIKHLHLLKEFFATTSVFVDLSHSNMIQRNLARFLGIQNLAPGEVLFEENDKADRLYIVVRGRIRLTSEAVPEPRPDDLNFVRTAGQAIGKQATHEKRSSYPHTAAADGPTILALVYREDYMRICATGDVQNTIDQFWALGYRESAPVPAGEAEMMDYDGYKQLYLRIGKVIATKERFSQSELRDAMHEDWRNDLAEFGDANAEVLTHAQYSDSLYQLIDEWCGGVESTQLYADLLRLMLDYSTDTTDTGLTLKPLNNVQCKFQQLADLRHMASKTVVQEQKGSKIGTAAVAGDSAGFKKAFLAQGIISGSGSASGGAPKVGKTKSKEEQQEEYFRDMFNSIDVDGSGSLDREEVAQLSIQMGRELRSLELDAAMAEMDPSGDGTVDFEEFRIWFKNTMDGDTMVRELFEAADKDESGIIDRDELRGIMKEMGNPLSPAQLDAAMLEMDSDGSGEIDFVEFSTWWSKLSSTQTLKAQGKDPQEEYYKEMFDKADTGGEGSLDRDELRELMVELGRPMADHELDTAMQLMDEDGGGTVDFDEFRKWFSWLVDGDMTIRKIFDSVDADGSGNLDHEEVRVALKRLCGEKEDGKELTDQEVTEAIALMDTDGSGEIDFEEFSTWWNIWEFQQRHRPDDPVVAHYRNAFDGVAKQAAERQGSTDPEQAKEAVLAIMQGRGKIDVEGFLALCHVLGRQIYGHEQQSAVAEVTEGTGGNITFEVFTNFFEDLKADDELLRDMFDTADLGRFGVLLSGDDGVRRVVTAFKQHESRGVISRRSMNIKGGEMSAAIRAEHGHLLVGPQQLNGIQSSLRDAIEHSFSDTSSKCRSNPHLRPGRLCVPFSSMAIVGVPRDGMRVQPTSRACRVKILKLACVCRDV